MFCHLHVHSPFSFLDGASSVGALLERTSSMGMPAMAITDHDSMGGAVFFRQAAERMGMKAIQGVELTLEGGYHLVLLARDTTGYSSISRVITKAHLGSERLKPRASWEDIAQVKGVFCLSGCRRGEIPSLILRGKYQKALEAARRYASLFGRENFFLEMEAAALPGSGLLNRALKEMSGVLGLRLVATANAHYARKEDFAVHDVLTCVRTLTRLEEVHPERRLNAENYLKSPGEMLEAVGERSALETAGWIARECQATPELGKRHYPVYGGAKEPRRLLEHLVMEGALERYGRIDDRISRRLRHELDIIGRLGYEDYFLLVWDIARYAREKRIRYAGRGSVADSAVAYCLRITEVDAIARDLLFERFLSAERAEKPDIDLDFDARYRDDVARYVTERYGEERVAWTCTYNTFRARSALRDLGKAMGYPEMEIDRLAKRMPYLRSDAIEEAMGRYPELGGSQPERYGLLLDICARVSSFPRHIGTHLGGIVIGGGPLDAIVPLQKSAKGVTITQFDKDGIEDIGLIKMDLLSLKTLSAVDTAVSSIKTGDPSFRYENIPLDDASTFGMIQSGHTIGVFQLESPAQRSLQSRLGAREVEDIVSSVALIRPGPIKGNMVEPFLARRAGRERVTYLHPDLKPILEKTYGVVLFQEQVIEIATRVGGFTPGDADRLRRAMTHYRSPEEMEDIGREFVAKAASRGVPEGTAREIFQMMKGYASYGFCEAHAAAFANTAYKTAYLIQHYPAHFFAAILSRQPMGYYSPATITVEARRRGLRILPLSINESGRDFQVEGEGIRVALSRVKGIRQEEVGSILKGRPYLSLQDFLERGRVCLDTAGNLVLGGAFDTLDDNRRTLLCQIEAWRRGVSFPGRPQDFSHAERILQEYEVLGLWVSGHYMEVFREHLEKRGFLSSCELERLRDGSRVRVAGLPVRPHRPPTRSGRTVVFLSLEDETGLIDIVVFENIYQRCGKFIFSPEVLPLEIEGTLKRRGRGASIVASRVKPMAPVALASWEDGPVL